MKFNCRLCQFTSRILVTGTVNSSEPKVKVKLSPNLISKRSAILLSIDTCGLSSPTCHHCPAIISFSSGNSVRQVKPSSRPIPCLLFCCSVFLAACFSLSAGVASFAACSSGLSSSTVLIPFIADKRPR